MDLECAQAEFLLGYFSTNDRRKKTQLAYLSDMSQFRVFLGKRFDILSLRNTHIEHWAAYLKSRGYSPASIRRKLAVLKIFCSYWFRRGLLSESPFWKVKVDVGRIVQLPRTLSDDEMKGLLRQARKSRNLAFTKSTVSSPNLPSARHFLSVRNAALLELLFATGMRVGEISALDISDFIPAQASIKVHGKGGKERMAFVVDKVALQLQLEYLDTRLRISTTSPAFFLNASGNRLSAQGIANCIHRLRKACGIDRNITPHMLRHTVATLLLRNGTDIRIVQEFLGHASVATTQRYTHVAKEHLIRELQSRHPSFMFRSHSPEDVIYVCG